jgi:hypothetical protein
MSSLSLRARAWTLPEVLFLSCFQDAARILMLQARDIECRSAFEITSPTIGALTQQKLHQCDLLAL